MLLLVLLLLAKVAKTGLTTEDYLQFYSQSLAYILDLLYYYFLKIQLVYRN